MVRRGLISSELSFVSRTPGIPRKKKKIQSGGKCSIYKKKVRDDYVTGEEAGGESKVVGKSIDTTRNKGLSYCVQRKHGYPLSCSN